MKAGAFFGYRCPNCGSTVDIGALAGTDTLLCPNCGTEMEPDPQGKTSAANVYCPNCRASFGLVNSHKCPMCGGPLQALSQ